MPYYIQNKVNGLVLNISGSQRATKGTKLDVWEKLANHGRQLWTLEPNPQPGVEGTSLFQSVEQDYQDGSALAINISGDNQQPTGNWVDVYTVGVNSGRQAFWIAPTSIRPYYFLQAATLWGKDGEMQLINIKGNQTPTNGVFVDIWNLNRTQEEQNWQLWQLIDSESGEPYWSVY